MRRCPSHRAELSRNGGPYEPLNTDAVGQVVAVAFVLITQWDTISASQNVTAELAPSYSLSPAEAGAYRITVTAGVALPAVAVPTYMATPSSSTA